LIFPSERCRSRRGRHDARAGRLGKNDRSGSIVRGRKVDAGRIHVLFANAGGGWESNLPFGSITEEQLVDGASVIMIGSTCQHRSDAALSVYSASRAAVRGFARHWTLDLKESADPDHCVQPRTQDARVEGISGGRDPAEIVAPFRRHARIRDPG
jgi:hypothetical protein